MVITRKNRFRPVFKQLLLLRENVQNNKKLLKFKKKKWERLVQHYKRKLKRSSKFKPQDQTQYTVTRYANKGTAYAKRFRNTLRAIKRFSLFYGGFSKKFIKTKINYVLRKNINTKILFLEQFETMLDTVLYRAKFAISIRSARQLIVHGKVFVNNSIVKNKNYNLKQGDIVLIEPKYAHIVEETIKRVQLWPIPPKHLFINYKTLQVIVGDVKHTNLSTNFTFNLELNKIILNYLKH